MHAGCSHIAGVPWKQHHLRLTIYKGQSR